MNFKEKFIEVIYSVLPVTIVVIILCLTVAPVDMATFQEFIIGALLLIMGLTIFFVGTDIGVMPLGEMMGSAIVKSRKLVVLIVMGFFIGFMVTVAEPDVQVLATQFAQVTLSAVTIPVFVVMISIGVGIFLALAFLRIIFKIPLYIMLLFSYALVFIAAALTSPNFLPVGFDSGGVTTGAMTVPFILSLGVGVTSVMGSKDAEQDSFGLVGLSSVGPILFVLILGVIYRDAQGSIAISEHASESVLMMFISIIPEVSGKVLMSITPMIVTFALFQIFVFKLPKRQIIKMSVGLVYTFIGLMLFLVGVEGGFLGAGMKIGYTLGSAPNNWILIPIGAIIGFVVVFAEPAVRVLTEQIENVSGGYVNKTSILVALSIAVGVSVSLAMIRVLVRFSLWWYIIPGYAIALILMKLSPPLFTAIAFDSGGVASGPMTATFILALTQGVALATGANIMTDAFGTVAMVAMTPLITIQVLGILIKRQQNKAELDAAKNIPEEIL